MNRSDIAHQVSLTLGNHAADYNIDGIVDDLIAAYEGDLTSIDAFDSESYWAIVETHDTTASTGEDSDPSTIAWLGVQASVLVHGEGPEIMVLDHKPDGDAPEVMPATSLPVALDADHDAMQDAAETALKAAGWETTGEWDAWDAVDTGYTIRVRRA